jgi:monofunctional biosynthetic peptidoglycan transglycosylase
VKKKKKGKRGRFLRTLFLIVILSLLAGIAYYSFYPDVSKLKRENPRKTAFMDYRQKERQAQGKKFFIQQKWVPLSKVSPYLVKAVLIAEDDKFWKHEGFDFDAIQKAIERDLKEGKFKFGGSTISQQLVKNLYLSPSKNPVRKLQEAIITWRMERNVSKRRILEIYLNVVEWGDGIFGIEAASLHHYGKSAMALSAEEASRLAAVLPNPLKYKVKGGSAYVEKRAAIIYNIMVKRGIVIPEYEELKDSSENGERRDSLLPEEGPAEGDAPRRQPGLQDNP